MENESNESKEQIVEEKHWENPEDYWSELLRLAEDDDVDGVEYLLLHRGKFKDNKLPGEDEIWQWLQGRAENKTGRKLLVELNEKGIIVPIENGGDK